MRKLFLMLLLLLFTTGCEEKLTESDVENGEGINNEVEGLKNEVIINFQLLDSNKVAKTVFSKDEKLFIDLLIRNELYSDLTYYYYGIPITLEIWKDDSLFATDFDYVGFEIITEEHRLKSGEEIKYKWLAPNSPGRYSANDLIVLVPGNYVAKVNPQTPVFFNEEIVEFHPIEFEIIE